jgi:hypothetical protein
VAAAATTEVGGDGDAAEVLGRPQLLRPRRAAIARRPRGRRAPEPGLLAGLSVRLAESSGQGAAEDRTGDLHPCARRRLRTRAPAPARVAEPGDRPHRPAASADMGSQSCAPGRRTRKVC